ncbi:unnamed protein product [Rhizoctonia solani]|uniref:NACHT domain-containing protein n=1 Tax=Rhizoctonia solani TaxID=456999 RepID=A0A8H2XYY4_9AGAM|nr:unnamed protein product [Rhizoctonia solani]
MPSTTGVPKSKKGFLSFLRNDIRRLSSRSSPPATPSLQPAPQKALSSIVVGETRAPKDTSGATGVTSSSSERRVIFHTVATPAEIRVESTKSECGSFRADGSSTLDPTGKTAIGNIFWNALRASLQGWRDTPTILVHLSLAAGILLECFDKLEAAAKKQEDYENLAKELTRLSESLTGLTKWSTPIILMTKAISSVDMGVEQQAKKLKQNLDQNGDAEDVMRPYREILTLFRKLQANLSLSAWSVTNERSVNKRLKELNPATLATYDSTLSSDINRRGCTEGTRTEVLSDLDSWVDGSDTPSVYWMNGMAGTGKTTIAYTFSERLERHERLGASFFCTRTSADCRDVMRVVPAIAYQLARYSIPFQSALYEILGKEPNPGSKDAEKQFERLLRDPLREVKDVMPDNLVVVIDALDECNDHEGVQTLLDTLFRYAQDVPLRFLVTSRPEPGIYERMTMDVQSRAALHLHDIETSLVQADIQLYLKEELAFIAPTEIQIGTLAQRSGGLFVYAAGLVRYIRSGKRFANPHQRLRELLSLAHEATKKYVEIDALYTSILASIFEEARMDQTEADDVKLVLRAVLNAQEPISIETVAALAGVDDTQRVRLALLPLRSVLHQSEQTGLVSTLGHSFTDFMFDHERSGSYFCDPGEHSQLIVQQCFAIMKEQLRFNICQLESSTLLDDQVHNIRSGVQRRISSTLAYACRNWASHLTSAPKSDDLLRVLGEFLTYRLLFWIEVLSLRQELQIGVDSLLKVKQWLMDTFSSPDLVTLLEDAYIFVQSFAASPASQSTPHIYISALQLCPRTSAVYKHYSKFIKSSTEVHANLIECEVNAHPSSPSWAVESGVLSIAYSPDGTRVAVGCENGTVSICDAYVGSTLVGPLRAHENWVRCVVFSPDGTRVLSASSDCTIRMWDAWSGESIAASFKGHTHPVKSIAFSSDGSHAVSGSWDNTVRVWNAADGAPVMDPLEGHTWGVNCVAFSPDGTLVASGGNDHIVRLWNIRHDPTGFDVTTLKGHAGAVMCISFTPDGTRLVSGSADCTIRVWNVSNGELVTHLLQGCTHLVYSVAVSPDGRCVASGSADHTLRVWDIDNGNLVAGPFVGHSSGVRSVTFSPEGSRLLSGSQDRSIKTWDIHKRGALSSSISSSRDQTPEHGNPVADSIDRTWTISCIPGRIYSNTHTIRSWTIRQDELAALTSHGHADGPAAAFSWSLGGSHSAYCSHPVHHSLALTETTVSVEGRMVTNAPKGWRFRSDGWIVDCNSALLFWAPLSSVSLHMFDHALFVFCQTGGAFILTKQGETLANQWQE